MDTSRNLNNLRKLYASEKTNTDDLFDFDLKPTRVKDRPILPHLSRRAYDSSLEQIDLAMENVTELRRHNALELEPNSTIEERKLYELQIEEQVRQEMLIKLKEENIILDFETHFSQFKHDCYDIFKVKKSKTRRFHYEQHLDTGGMEYSAILSLKQKFTKETVLLYRGLQRETKIEYVKKKEKTSKFSEFGNAIISLCFDIHNSMYALSQPYKLLKRSVYTNKEIIESIKLLQSYCIVFPIKCVMYRNVDLDRYEYIFILPGFEAITFFSPVQLPELNTVQSFQENSFYELIFNIGVENMTTEMRKVLAQIINKCTKPVKKKEFKLLPSKYSKIVDTVCGYFAKKRKRAVETISNFFFKALYRKRLTH